MRNWDGGIFYFLALDIIFHEFQESEKVFETNLVFFAIDGLMNFFSVDRCKNASRKKIQSTRTLVSFRPASVS